jgi:hypothetical protein
MFWLWKTLTDATQDSSIYGNPAINQIFNSFIANLYHSTQSAARLHFGKYKPYSFPKSAPSNKGL